MRHLLCLVGVVLTAPVLAQEPTPGLSVDKEKKAVIIEARVAPRKIPDPKFMDKVYPVEVIASWPYEKMGQKAHETILTFDVKPGDVHKALESLGAKPGKPVYGDTTEKATGHELRILVEVPGEAGPRRVPIDQVLIDTRFNKTMPKVKWRFTGSALKKPDPAKDETVYGADLTGTLISIFPVTNETVIQSELTLKEEKFLKMETNPKVLPKEGTPVKLIIEVVN